MTALMVCCRPKVTPMKPRGGKRPGSGRPAVYRDKTDRFTLKFTGDGWRALDALQRETALSRNDVMVALVLSGAGAVTFDRHPVAYTPKLESTVAEILLPAEAGALLREARARTGHSFSDVGEALVREHAEQTAFPPPVPTRTRTRRPRRPAVRSTK